MSSPKAQVPLEPPPRRRWLWYRRFVLLLCAGLALLNLWGFTVYLRESRRLQQVADETVAGAGSKSEEMRRLVRFVAEEVPVARPRVSFLLPVFSPLRPTACQVLDHGGDCSYKARAFVVLAGHRGIEATRLALYQPNGVSTHAVAVARTERGDYVCDLLFGIVYDREDGSPIPVEELQSDPAVLAASIEREVQRGNVRAAKYPLEKYSFFAPRSFHWDHNPVLGGLYRVLAWCFGRAWVDKLSIPHFMNEPAQVVGVASLIAMAMLWLPLGVGRRKPGVESTVAAARPVPPPNLSTPDA